MRYVALVLIVLSLPVFIAWLQSASRNRDYALMAMGLLVFAQGSLSVDAAVISWPLWNGTSRGISVSPLEMLAIALLVTRKRGGARLPFIGVVFGYLAILALSVLYSRMPMASMFSVWDFVRSILIFMGIGYELARPTALRALLRGLSVGLMLQAGYVINQKLSGVVQAPGTLAHQNLLGMMTVLAVLPLLGSLLEGERDWLIKIGVFSGLLIVAGGGSRGALAILVGASVLLVLVSLIRRQTSHKYTIAGGAVLMMLLAAPFAYLTLQDRFGSSSMITQEKQRAAMEVAADGIARDNPFGVGANVYVNVSNLDGYADRAGVAWQKANRSVPVHNAYKLARAETGYHGLAAFVLLLVVPLLAGLRHAFRYRRGAADGLVLGGVAGLGAVVVQSNFEYAIAVHVVQTPMIVCMAIIAGRMRAARMERSVPAPLVHEGELEMPRDQMPALPRNPWRAR